MAGAGAGGVTGLGVAGSKAPSCESSDETSVVGIASLTMSAPGARLEESVTLAGPGVMPVLSAQENVTSGLRWQNDRLFLLTDSGFWDLALEGPAIWNPTATILVLGVRAGDIDHDGDQDMMLLTSGVQTVPAAGAMPGGVVTRLAVWERTKTGLSERTEVLQSPRIVLPMPYVFGDVDGDADLDVVTFESGAPVAYVNDGAFGFERTMLGAETAEYKDSIVTALAYGDRNGDSASDLLVVAGVALEASAFVLLGDGSGKLLPPGRATKDESPLVPHGPTGTGIGIADVTGDGIADVVQQDAQSAMLPILRLLASTDPSSLAPAVEMNGLGFEFADIDEDGKLDIITTVSDRLLALLARGNGAFEMRDLGIDVAMPAVRDFVADPGEGDMPARLHILYNLPCEPCGPSCSGRCVFGACVGCLSDADCTTGRCTNQQCAP